MGWLEQEPRPGDDRPGCLDALLITRIAFGILLLPIAALLGTAAAITVVVLALATYPAQTLIAAAVIAVASGAAWRVVARRRRRTPGN